MALKGMPGVAKVADAAKSLKPNNRNPLERYGREKLAYAQQNVMVGDFGAPPGWPSQSPASAKFTPGLPGEGKANKKKEQGDPTIQPGIRRP